MSMNSSAPGYTPPVRKIRQVVDPRSLYNRDQVTDQIVKQGASFQQDFTQQVIQKRIEEQRAKEAAAQKKRMQELLAAQQRAANSTAARNQRYADSLNDYMASTPQLTYEAANNGGPHTKAYQRALDWANNQVKNPSQDWTRDCQMFARTAVGAKAFGTSALNAWKATPNKNKHYTYPPRPGSIAYYANPKNPGFGHAVFVGDNGKVYSTDIRRTGQIDIVNWNVFQKEWGMQYLGWIDTTANGQRLPVQGY